MYQMCMMGIKNTFLCVSLSVESIISEDFFNDTWEIPENLDEEKILVQIRDRKYTFDDFAAHIENNQGSKNIKENIVNELYKDFLNKNFTSPRYCHTTIGQIILSDSKVVQSLILSSNKK